MHLAYLVLLFVMAVLARDWTVGNQTVHEYAWFGKRQHGALRGLPALGYEISPRSSVSSLAPFAEKGWDLYQQKQQPSYDQYESQLRRASKAPREPDHLEIARLSQVEQYRMDRHPYQTAEPAMLQLPKAPMVAKTTPPLARDWAGPAVKTALSGNTLELAPPGLSPVVFNGGEKVLVQQPQPTRARLPQPQLSLYPQQVTNAGLNTKPIITSPAPIPAIGGRRRRGTTDLGQSDPLVATGMRAPSPWEPGHLQGGSVDSVIRPGKHRPPPLDLSAVSNMPGTEPSRRRR